LYSRNDLANGGTNVEVTALFAEAAHHVGDQDNRSAALRAGVHASLAAEDDPPHHDSLADGDGAFREIVATRGDE